jgi:NitT/TauT family transport system permease protein
MAVAIDQGDHRAMTYGVIAMSIVIVFVDFVIWRPVMAWVKKFQMEEIPEDIAELPFVTTFLRDSWLIRRLKAFWKKRASKKRAQMQSELTAIVTSVAPVTVRLRLAEIHERFRKHRRFGVKILGHLVVPAAIAISIWGGTRAWELVRTLNASDWRLIWASVGLTFIRVLIATLLSSIWTIPVAILIGLSPRLTRVFQPIVQVVASFPAPMVYPIVIVVMLRLGISMNFGASLLMLMGVQWYILFNVLAGAMSVTRDLKDTMQMIGVRRWVRWVKLYLPAAFPSLVTGWVTAAGGAWNASIVAEYIPYSGKTLIAPGIGSMISRASAEANFPLLAGCLIAMVATVVGLNQTFWRWLSEEAENRFRFER